MYNNVINNTIESNVNLISYINIVNVPNICSLPKSRGLNPWSFSAPLLRTESELSGQWIPQAQAAVLVAESNNKKYVCAIAICVHIIVLMQDASDSPCRVPCAFGHLSHFLVWPQ